ncbi:hypothetical protein HLH35_17065 [Gluconacetobacter asukensis]|uniref:Uncharacterized protein n=2 Tax=Gluconacetobacter asukensis TaxID=1017181 RepID=A0A7W4J3F6_9PROT|nr:hypothetical protein [Gluconacetobacter asukensis]
MEFCAQSVYISRALGRWWKARSSNPVQRRSQMVVFAPFILLSVLGLFCWLIFVVAVYALPFYVGLNAFFGSLHTGAGYLGAIVIGIVAGTATQVAGQMAFAMVPIVWFRMALGLLYTVPAVIAGYCAMLDVSQLCVPSSFWRHLFAVIGAVLVGGTAWVRIGAELPPATPAHGEDGTLPGRALIDPTGQA